MTVSVKRKRIVLGIRPAVFVGGTREGRSGGRFWRDKEKGTELVGKLELLKSSSRSVPHRGSLGRGPSHGLGTQLGTTEELNIELGGQHGYLQHTLLWSVHHLVCLQRAVSHLTPSLML